MNALRRHTDPPPAKTLSPLGQVVPPAYPLPAEQKSEEREVRATCGFIHIPVMDYWYCGGWCRKDGP